MAEPLRRGKSRAPAAAPSPNPEQSVEAWIEALKGGSLRAARQPAAVRLAQWIDWTDAIALAAALEAGAGKGKAGAGKAGAGKGGEGKGVDGKGGAGKAGTEEALTAEHGHGRGGTAGLMREPRQPRRSPASDPPAQRLSQIRQQVLSQVRAGLQETLQRAPRDRTAIRHAIAQAQRQMEAAVSRLRAGLQSALQEGSPAQRELAELDAVLEQALIPRQRALLSGPGGAPGRLARLSENAELSVLEPRLMAALSAELELRLQPLQGLVQALQDTPSSRP